MLHIRGHNSATVVATHSGNSTCTSSEQVAAEPMASPTKFATGPIAVIPNACAPLHQGPVRGADRSAALRVTTNIIACIQHYLTVIQYQTHPTLSDACLMATLPLRPY